MAPPVSAATVVLRSLEVAADQSTVVQTPGIKHQAPHLQVFAMLIL